jgi:hypothetical protein
MLVMSEYRDVAATVLFKINLEFSLSFPGFSFSGLDSWFSNLGFKPQIHFI